ncbi:hypothetical protein CEXT_442381, partial [Caerostris extrusa]
DWSDIVSSNDVCTEREAKNFGPSLIIIVLVSLKIKERCDPLTPAFIVLLECWIFFPVLGGRYSP